MNGKVGSAFNVGAILLMATGVPETLAGPAVFPTLEDPNISQAIALGPVAHFEIIKHLGENGGGFFAINSAHPFENPNGFSNLIEIVAMLSIPLLNKGFGVLVTP